jgi:hypothetical protein
MIRTFKYVALVASGTPQPIFGTTTSAACAPAAPPGSTQSANINTQVEITVADSSFFSPQDPVMADVGANQERTTIVSVPDSTHIIVAGLTLKHASGIYVYLAVPMSSLYVQTLDGNTGYIMVGTSPSMVIATGVFCMSKLQPVTATTQPVELSSAIQGFSGPLNTSQLWFDGSHTGDKILPSFSTD